MQSVIKDVLADDDGNGVPDIIEDIAAGTLSGESKQKIISLIVSIVSIAVTMVVFYYL